MRTQVSQRAYLLVSMGVAEIDDTKAVTTVRTIAEVKRIVYEDVMRDQVNSRKSPSFYTLKSVLDGFRKNLSTVDPYSPCLDECPSFSCMVVPHSTT
jgi:hypothetical protein